MLIRRPGQAWHQIQPVLHDERALQTLLAQSPGLLPSPGHGELAVAANFKLGSTGSIDILGVGIDGRVVLVECGRQEGPGRRPMGGAALTAAAGLWRAPFEDIDAAFAARAGVTLVEAAATLAQAAGFAFDEAAFREAVTASLSAGTFLLVLAVDSATDEVRQVVSYLNAGARPGLSAVALGLRYLAEDEIEILLPSVYRGEGLAAESTLPATQLSPAATPATGNAATTGTVGGVSRALPARPGTSVPPAASPAPPPPPRPAATAPPAEAEPAAATTPAPASESAGQAVSDSEAEAALFKSLSEACLPAAVESVRRLYDIARMRGQELQWGQGEHPSVTAVFDIAGAPVGVWSCYTDLKPSFVINFEWLVPHVAPAGLQKLADALGQLQSVPERLAGLSDAGYRRRLALAVNAVLAQPGSAEVIASALDELLDNAAAEASSAS
jgi:hypothetical protein